MQEVKTVDLAGPALDWAIAQIEGVEVAIAAPQYGTDWRVYKPNHIELSIGDEDYWAERASTGPRDEARQSFAGPTMLIAACRAIVAAKLGNAVQVPKELNLPKQLGECSNAYGVGDQLNQPSVMPSSLEA
jgi:hypothetical protein